MNRASARLMPSRVSRESVRRYIRSPESLKNVSVRRILLLSALLYLGTLAWAGGGRAEEASQSLRNELEALSARHGFAIVGSGKLEAGATAFDNGGKLSKRLESLLGGYNFILMFDAAGAVRELHILGPRPTAEGLGCVLLRRAGTFRIPGGTSGSGDTSAASSSTFRFA